MSILKVENLSKIYGEKDTKTIAVDNVSFEVEKGEFVAIVGTSGSGKSTLLHMIGGVDKPTSGTIEINGVKYKVGTIEFTEDAIVEKYKKKNTLFINDTKITYEFEKFCFKIHILFF